MPEKISIMKESGELLNSNIVSIFMIPDSQKKYIITTENAVDPHGLTVLHVSELINNDEDLAKVSTDEEWSSIKTIMRAIISGNVGSYQYMPLIEKTRGKGQYSRDISVSASACKQMVDNYTTALKSLSETKVETPTVEVNNGSSDGIFPSENVVTNEINEVSPGIADVTKEEVVAPAPVAEVAPVPVATPLEASAAPSILQGVPTENNISTSESSPVVAGPVPLDSAASVQEVVQSTPVEVAPASPAAEPVVNEQSVVESAVETPAPVEEVKVVEPVQEPIPAVAEVAPVAEPTPVVVTEPPVVVEPVQNIESPVSVDTPAIAVAEPAKTDDVAVSDQVNNSDADTDAITALTNSLFDKLKDIQNLSAPSEVPNVQTSVNVNATPSFAPEASLDEVVVGAQDMFMSGVQNLVETITEKVYRDLYKKEKELDQREELLNQREKMLNEQISMMVNNFNNNRPVDSTSTQVN